MPEFRVPVVTAPLMGYGHLRAAAPLAEAFGTRILRSDRPPGSSPAEAKLWRRIRRFYEGLSRISQWRVTGVPARWFLDWLTAIPPPGPPGSEEEPTRSAHTMERLRAQGLHRTLLKRLAETGEGVLSTFYSAPIAADRAGLGPAYCVVTDADANRVWAPLRPRRTRIRYFVPTRRAQTRLAAFGVPDTQVELTGFPLPPVLVGANGDEVLLGSLAGRLDRLDPSGEARRRLEEAGRGPLPAPPERRPPLLVFAIGGAGAQMSVIRRALPDLARLVQAGRLRLALVAGIRREVAHRLLRGLARAGLGARRGKGVDVLWRPDFDSYYAAFNRLLAEADVLWTKPGELVFYAALGLPLVLAPPVGVQEMANARWVRSHGAALPQGDPHRVGTWLVPWLERGDLARAAVAGFEHLPHEGTRRIVDAVRRGG